MDHGARPLPLLDVLEHLPVTLLRHSFWPLLASNERSCFRLASRPSRRLADQLTRSFRFNFSYAPTPQTMARLPFRHLLLVGAALGRQENIETLTLDNTEDEASVEEALRLGRPGCRRTQHLRIRDCSSLAGLSGGAVARACPALRTLVVTSCHDPSYEYRLRGPFFASLHTLQHLTRVEFCNAAVDPAVVAALAMLPALETLKISGGDTIELAALPHLAALTGLRELRLKARLLEDPAALRALACLRSLTRLTRLRIRSDVGYRYEDEAGISEATMAAGNAALAQLGPLCHLSSLRLGDMVGWVDGVGLAGLRQMAALTQLHLYAGIRTVGRTEQGALPQLCELRLQETVSGQQLLSTLHALSPVQHLTCLTARISLAPGSTAEVWAEDLAALRRCGECLADAPPQAWLDLTLSGDWDGASEGDGACEGDVAAALAALAPLRQRLQHVEVLCCSVPQLKSLGVELARYTCLTELRMWDSLLDAGTVIDIAQHALALRVLNVGTHKHGASPLLALALVATRVHPLHVNWTPLTAHELGAIEAVLQALDRRGVSISATYTRIRDDD